MGRWESPHLSTPRRRGLPRGDLENVINAMDILPPQANQRLRGDFFARFRSSDLLLLAELKTRFLATQQQEDSRYLYRAMGKQIGGEAEAERSSVISGVNASLDPLPLPPPGEQGRDGAGREAALCLCVLQTTLRRCTRYKWKMCTYYILTHALTGCDGESYHGSTIQHSIMLLAIFCYAD